MDAIIKLMPLANPLRFEQLTGAQQQVCTHVLKMLQAYASHQNVSSQGNLQTNRVSNMIFIDGERGIGKSTLMLSLMLGCQSQGGSDFFKSDQTTSPEENALQAIFQDTAFLNRLIWLNTLDLELLPKNTNLLASILVRIEEAFKHVSAFSESEKTSVLFPATEQHPWTRFKKLINDVSLGWDSSLLERRTVDPDTYSQDLMRTERARLSFAGFHNTLTEVGSLYKDLARLNGQPLFILPIDDADLNPQRYLELFRLTRILSSNHLIFLIAGNVENLEFLFELSFADELNQISDAEFLSRRHDKIAAMAARLGHAARRKLIPSAPHLIRIQPLSVEEGFAFKPENLPDFKAEEITFEANKILDWRLQGLFKALDLPLDEEGKNPFYRDYLSPVKDLNEYIDLKAECQRSSLAEIVAGPSRTIHDLWLKLYELILQRRGMSDREKLLQLVAFLAQEYRSALNENQDLPGDIQEQFRELFMPSGGFSLQQRIHRDVYVEPESLPRIYESVNRSNEVYQFRKPGPLKISLKKDDKHYTLKQNSVNAWAYLLHDISLLIPGSTIEKLDFSKVTHYWAQSHLYSRDNQEIIMWPCPDWLCFHYYERFRLYWNACLDLSQDIEKLDLKKMKNMEIIPYKLNYLAFCWIRGITSLIYEPNELQPYPVLGQDGYAVETAQRWEYLANWISSKAMNTPSDWSSLRVDYKNQWIHTFIPRMLAPETGLPLECVKKFQRYIRVFAGSGLPPYATHLSQGWPRFAEQINEDRANNIIKYFDKQLMIPIEQAKRNIVLLEMHYSTLKNAKEEDNPYNQNPIETFENGNDKPLALSHVLTKAREIIDRIEGSTSKRVQNTQEKKSLSQSTEPGSSTSW